MANVVNLRKEKVYNPRSSSYVHDYKTLFRFEEQNVEYLATNLLPNTGETRGGALSPKQRMEAFLRYSADPGFQKGVGEDLGVNQSTVCRNFHGVMDDMLQFKDTWIRFPSSPSEFEAAKKFRIPNSIGVIDGTHIYIAKPHNADSPDEYINRKQRQSF